MKESFYHLLPLIFHRLELSFPSTTAGTKKFPDEISPVQQEANIRTGRLNSWGNPEDSLIIGSQLIETIWSKISSFPSADCKVLEDIDAIPKSIVSP